MKHEQSKLLSSRSLLAAIVLIAFVVGCTLVYVWRLYSEYIPQVSFEETHWARSIDAAVPEVPTHRQKMIKDLVANVLAGLNRTQIEKMLGNSPSHKDMRRHRMRDIYEGQFNDDGTLVRRGEGYYYDEYSWDLIYPIGVVWSDSLELDMKDENLIIRLDQNERFESWYVAGSKRHWAFIVGTEGAATYRRTR